MGEQREEEGRIARDMLDKVVGPQRSKYLSETRTGCEWNELQRVMIRRRMSDAIYEQRFYESDFIEADESSGSMGTGEISRPPCISIYRDPFFAASSAAFFSRTRAVESRFRRS